MRAKIAAVSPPNYRTPSGADWASDASTGSDRLGASYLSRRLYRESVATLNDWDKYGVGVTYGLERSIVMALVAGVGRCGCSVTAPSTGSQLDPLELL